MIIMNFNGDDHDAEGINDNQNDNNSDNNDNTYRYDLTEMMFRIVLFC